jgi:hypothetical protein
VIVGGGGATVLEPLVGVADGARVDACGDDVLDVGGAVVADGGCVVVAVPGEVLGLATGMPPPERVRTTTKPTSATMTVTTMAGAQDRHGEGAGRR